MRTTDFYKLESPTTAQFIKAIENYEYFTMEQFNKKKKQLKVYLSDLWCEEPVIGFENATNAGGFPIVFPLSQIFETLTGFCGEPPCDEDIELFSMYIQKID